MTNDYQSPESASAPENSGQPKKNWVDYLLIIREHILISIILAAIVSGFYFHDKSKAIPLYRSSALVIFEIQKDRIINVQEVTDVSLGRGAGGETILKNHLTDLRSNSFRQRVVESLTPEEIETIRKGYATEEDPEPGLHGIIAGANHIRQIGGNIFNFQFHHRNPDAAALLANRFFEEFNDYLYERARRSNDSAIRFLRSQSEELKLRVERAELAVQRYRQERNLVSLEESQNYITSRMMQVSSELNNTKLQLVSLDAAVTRIEEAEGDIEKLSQMPSIASQGDVASILQNRRNLAVQRESLSLRYGRRHPRMVENAADIASADKQIQVLVKKAVGNIRQQRLDLKQRIESLSQALTQAEKESLELDQIAIEYNVLRRKMETDQALFTQVHQRLNEAILASQLTDTNLRLVDRAWPAGSPFTPDTTKTMTSSVFLFLFITVSVPYAIYFLNLRLRSASDIEEILQIPYLGEIRKLPRKVKTQQRLVLDNLDDHGVESFRQIISQILLRVERLRKGHTFVITSAIPKEGKSFFAANLSAAFARHHKKVLLIDADFRRPSMNHLFSVRSSVDPENSGQEANSLGEPIQLAPNLDLLPSYKATTEATELIDAAFFQRDLAKFKEIYDIVIIDTPPAGLFPDAPLLAEKADHSIFLTQLNKHQKTFLQGVTHRVGQAKAPIIGVVVNKVTRRKARHLGAYKYADYTKYKSYYSPQKHPPSKS